jgi:hypothetical protein
MLTFYEELCAALCFHLPTFPFSVFHLRHPENYSQLEQNHVNKLLLSQLNSIHFFSRCHTAFRDVSQKIPLLLLTLNSALPDLSIALSYTMKPAYYGIATHRNYFRSRKVLFNTARVFVIADHPECKTSSSKEGFPLLSG